MDSLFPEQAMGRATASSRIDGNRIELQFEGPATFDAWAEAIASARTLVHFENYILRDDEVGRRFRDLLTERARAGVAVRVVHDWMGCWATPRRYWRPFREAGVEVRAYNPPSVRDPFGLLQRDHRKLVVVDDAVAYMGGFCVGQEWAGTATDPPWRDTGVALKGPAVAHAARTFERIWDEMGDPVPPELRLDPAHTPAVGTSPVWLIEGLPWHSRVYRATQLMASVASHRIWITDPYFLAPRPVTDALTAAARDGVDVRVVVPAHNNWPWVGSLSRGGYRRLLEAGVRIFEWQGGMIHAKTSVVDGRWCRIGSSNLNAASLLGNWELDVGVLDSELAQQVEGLFLADLASAVEIVLPRWHPVPAYAPETREAAALGVTSLDDEASLHDRFLRLARGSGQGAQSLTLADLFRAGSTLGDAIAGHRTLGREDHAVLGTVTFLLLVIALLSALFPRFVGWTLAALFGWFGVVLAVRGGLQSWKAWRERVQRRRDRRRTDEPEGPQLPSTTVNHGGDA